MLSYEGRHMGKFVNEELPWLITSQREYELNELVRIYKELQPKYVLEIGTQEGGTLYQWIKHAVPGAVIVNIDILQNQPSDNKLLDRWHSWRRDDIELISIIDYSKNAVERVRAELPHIDFLFIDGDHTYQGVKTDFELYGPMVSGGVIAFHDLMTPKNGIQNHIQVGRLWREIQHAGYLTKELWCDPDPDWGGIGVVYVPTQENTRGGSHGKGTAEAVQPVREYGHLSDMRQEEAAGGTA